MTPDEAQAELEDILIECRDVVSQAWVLDKLLARPEVVLAALGAESEWEQRAEMFEHQSRQWQERYAKCSDLLSDAEESAEVAEAEVERLNEVVVAARERADTAEKMFFDTIALDLEHVERARAAEAEVVRLRRALQQIVDWTDLKPTNVRRGGVRDFVREVLSTSPATTSPDPEETKP